MKDAIFKLITDITAAIINLITAFSDFTKVVVARTGWFLMGLIDQEKIKAYDEYVEAASAPHEQNELQSQQTELNLLSAASQVRDHAKESGDWTDSHSEAIEAVGNSLLELGWEEECVHQYLKQVVESIDGLTYSDYFE